MSEVAGDLITSVMSVEHLDSCHTHRPLSNQAKTSSRQIPFYPRIVHDSRRICAIQNSYGENHTQNLVLVRSMYKYFVINYYLSCFSGKSHLFLISIQFYRVVWFSLSVKIFPVYSKLTRKSLSAESILQLRRDKITNIHTHTVTFWL